MFAFLKKNPLNVLIRKGWEFAGNYRPAMIVYFVLFILAEATSLAEPYLIGRMLNCVQSGLTGPAHSTAQSAAQSAKLWDELFVYLMIFFGLQALFWAFHGPGRIIERIVAFHIKANYKMHLFRTVTQLPLQWHRDHHSGQSIDKINRASNSLAAFFDSTFEVSYMLFRVIGSQLILFTFMPFAGGVAIAATAVAFAIIFLFDACLYRQYSQLNKFENSVASAVHDYVTNITSVITLRLENRVLSEVGRRIGLALPLFKRNATINEIKWFSTTMLIATMTVIVLCNYAHGELSAGKVLLAGTFFTLFEYMRRLGDAFYEFAGIYGTVVKQAADVEGAETILSAKTNDAVWAEKLPADWKTLTVSNLHFKYEDENHREHHLDDVNIQLCKGTAIAFVGESGSGKSTLMSLLRGVHSTDRVHIECDGKALKSGLHAIAPATTLIPQDPELFADTIRFNITFGIEADEAEVMKAVKLACFDGVLARLPEGLDTNIAEKGVNLSGGEKQRLALARGIFFARESDIILLDEPTSSVDIINEKTIYTNLLEEFRDKCIISSIHKPHLLEQFDRIYVFRNGRVAQGEAASERSLEAALR